MKTRFFILTSVLSLSLKLSCSPVQNAVNFGEATPPPNETPLPEQEKNEIGSREITQNIELALIKKVDLIIVTDNSVSMKAEQAKMADKIANLIDQMTGIDWRIGVITTDMVNSSFGQGVLQPMRGLTNTFFLEANKHTSQVAKTVLGSTVQRTESGDANEQGIAATFALLRRTLNPNDTRHRNFIRSESDLAVVVLSDEDETGQKPENDPDQLLNFIQSTWRGKKRFLFHSIITIPKDQNCLDGEGYAYGDRYFELSEKTGFGFPNGSIVGSICSQNYGDELASIGASLQNFNRSQTLQCAAEQGSLRMFKQGIEYKIPYLINGTQLELLAEPPTGSITLTYRCPR